MTQADLHKANGNRVRRMALLMAGAAWSVWPTTAVAAEAQATATTTLAQAASTDAATAQTTPQPVSASDNTQAQNEPARAIEDVVVTARLRSESLQTTPLSVSAFNANTIQNAVVFDVNSIQKLLPNVQLSRIQYSGNALGASIRGISFADLEKTFDPAIGVAIDGVFLGTNTGANVDFNDIGSIEVLRGPQGTLYGRNTIGGTISIRRTKPTGELGVKINARYASFNTLDLGAVVNLPKFGNIFSLKLFGQRLKSDSFTRNRYTGDREPGRNYYTFGGALQAEVGETTALLTVETQRDRSHYPSAVNLTQATGRPFGAGGTICDYTLAIGLGTAGCAAQGYLRQGPENYELANTAAPFESYLAGWDGSFEINSKIGGFNLVSVTGYRSTHDILRDENTGTPPLSYTGVPGAGVPLFFTSRDQTYSQFSQELRVQGDVTPWADIVAGVYYLHTKYEIQPAIYNGGRAGNVFLAVPIFVPGAAPFFVQAPIQRFTAGQKLDSYAVFAESIFKLGHNLRLTVGGRYTTETKDFHLEQQSAPAFTAAAKKTFSNPTGRVILDWTPQEGMMLYASWSRGFRSGGFNGRSTTAAAIGPYNPERVDSYEAGMKADFLGGELRFNPTVFWVNYTNKQEEVLRPSSNGQGTETIVDNAATARVRGIELEVQARPTRELTLRASGGYLDAKYLSFLVPNLAVPGTFTDIRGVANFRRAPKYTANASVDYLHNFNDELSGNVTIDYSYIDKLTTSPRVDPTGAQRDVIPAHGRWDATIALIHTGDTLKNFRLAVYGHDLFHEGNRITNTLDAGVFDFGQISPQREFGVEATIRF